MSWNTKRQPAILLTFIILVLLLSILWSINKVGGYVGSVNIPRAYICREIENNRIPVPVSARLPFDQQQLCLWFEYENAGKDDKMKVVCYKDKEEIIRQQIVPKSKNGVRAFYLVKNDGSALPAGKYRIVISTATDSWNTIPETFEITEKKFEEVTDSKDNKNKRNVRTKGTGKKTGGRNGRR